MKRATKIVTIVCVFSILFVGCYTSDLIDPKGVEKEKLYTDDIEAVVTKDGKGHEFDTPANADSTSISGMVLGKQLSVPLSDVQRVQVSSYSPIRTILLSLYAGIALIFYIAERQ